VLDSAVRNARIVGRGLTPIGAICSPSILWPNTALRRMRTVITELAEMGVADHVLESISGHVSRKMLAHYLRIRLDAERKALDALDERHEQER